MQLMLVSYLDILKGFQEKVFFTRLTFFVTLQPQTLMYILCYRPTQSVHI